MVALPSFFVVVFASTFQPGVTQIHLENNSVEIIGVERNISESIRTEFNAGSKLDFSSDIEPILQLWICCPIEEARIHGACLLDNITAENLQIKTKIGNLSRNRTVLHQNIYLSVEDPCAFYWMVPFVFDNFYISGNGLISVGTDCAGRSLQDFEHYCLFRNPGSVEYSARACYPLIRKSIWLIFCSVFVLFVTTAIFVVYTVIPEQRNLHGSIFRSYIATYGSFAVAILAIEFTTESKTSDNLFLFSESAMRYCAASTAFWLNAMSFNIWRTFRNLRVTDVNIRERNKRNFIGYAIYAWVSPAVIVTAITLPLYFLPYLRHEVLGYNEKLWACVGVISAVYICNAFLFTSTALTIRRQRRDTISSLNNVNRHGDIDEYWFNLHLKLFVLLGGHIVSWVVWLVWPTQTMAHILASLEVVQGCLIFIFFVWKDNVKRSFWNEVSPWRRRDSAVASWEPQLRFRVYIQQSASQTTVVL